MKGNMREGEKARKREKERERVVERERIRKGVMKIEENVVSEER